MSQNETEIVVDPVEPIVTTRRVDVEILALECDVRVGGTWRALYRRPNGDEFGFHGEFREVAAPERLVRTFILSAAADEAVETIVLAESGPGKTLITTKTAFKTIAIRDGRVQHGMESGMRGGYLQLDSLIASLVPHSGTANQATA
jgi:uncharacterized protein YndB with AHSA1/START domain